MLLNYCTPLLSVIVTKCGHKEAVHVFKSGLAHLNKALSIPQRLLQVITDAIATEAKKKKKTHAQIMA